ELQLVLSPPADGGDQSFQVFSALGVDGPWTLHARGTLDRQETRPQPGELAPLQAWRQSLTPLDVEELYAAFAGRGLHYGPSFRGIEAVWTGNGEAPGLGVRPDVG